MKRRLRSFIFGLRILTKYSQLEPIKDFLNHLISLIRPHEINISFAENK